jgi:PTH1 family peptidyl-tRNA hydrolase
MEKLRIIVGLGNPGGEYSRTRHNAGFMAVDVLAGRQRLDWALERKFNALLAPWAGGAALLCKPQTFMNASGESVAPLAFYHRVEPARCLVVVDDADLPLGELRLRPHGGTGGHHGLESVERHLGTPNFPRLRIGIGRRNGEREITGHVLGRFSTTESEWLQRVLARAADQIECWASAGIEQAMNRFNGTVVGSDNERQAK